MTRRPENTRREFFPWIVAVLLLAIFPFFGCAVLTPRPVQDLKTIAGKWEGNLAYQAAEYGTTTIGVTWVINEDGTYEMSTGKWKARGTMRLSGGRILFFDGPLGSGIASLHEGPNGMVLISTGDAPGTHAAFSRAN